MAHASPLTRRKPAEWVARGVLAIGAAWLGFHAVTHSLAYVVRVRATEQAHAMAPGNARITALLAVRMLRPGAKPEDFARAKGLARTALRQDASVVDAVATLALLAQGRQDHAQAQRLFAYSKRLSRRDLRSRLGMIEESVARNDVPGALRNYDIALRTSRLSSEILFPVLSSAITDTMVRRHLIDMLAKQPPWAGAFISHVTMHGSDALAAAALLRALHRQRVGTPPDAPAIIIDRLLAQNEGQAAWAFYATVVQGTEPRRSRDPSFDKGPEVASAFDWRALQGSGISTTLQRDADGGIFDFSVVTSVGGPLLRQTQVLPPGDYILEGRSAGIDQADGSLPYWSLTCLSGREIGRVAVPNSDQNDGGFAGKLTVPADCPVQQLTLVASASDKVGGVTGQIHQTAIRPVQQAEAK